MTLRELCRVCEFDTRIVVKTETSNEPEYVGTAGAIVTRNDLCDSQVIYWNVEDNKAIIFIEKGE